LPVSSADSALTAQLPPLGPRAIIPSLWLNISAQVGVRLVGPKHAPASLSEEMGARAEGPRVNPAQRILTNG